MFQDALQSLLDWLSAVEPSLSTETAVMGDPETVQILIDNHKVRKVCYVFNTKRKAWQKFWSDPNLVLETYQANTKLVFWPPTKHFRCCSIDVSTWAWPPSSELRLCDECRKDNGRWKQSWRSAETRGKACGLARALGSYQCLVYYQTRQVTELEITLRKRLCLHIRLAIGRLQKFWQLPTANFGFLL